MYQKRHDKIVYLTHDKVVGKRKSDTVVFKDTFITPQTFDSHLPNLEHPHTRYRQEIKDGNNRSGHALRCPY